MKKELSIETVHVEICVVRVGGHKMTLATFKQIPEVDFFQAKEDHSPLGWVSYPSPWPYGVCYEKEDGKMNQYGCWILCISPEGTLKKAVWPDTKKPPNFRQLYMAT